MGSTTATGCSVALGVALARREKMGDFLEADMFAEGAAVVLEVEAVISRLVWFEGSKKLRKDGSEGKEGSWEAEV